MIAPLRRFFGRSGAVMGINRRNLDLVFPGHHPGRFRAVDDKVVAKRRLKSLGVAVPRTIGILRSAADAERVGELLSHEQGAVLKPGRGWGGRGILVLARTTRGWETPSGRILSVDAIATHARAIQSGTFSLDEAEDVALVEERVVAGDFFENLSPLGLADIRIVTHKNEPVQAMARIPTIRSGGRANLHAGGVGAGIDVATGQLTSAVCCDRPVRSHPDTGAELEGLRIPDWAECLALAREASRSVDLDYLGVDIVVDRVRGPLVLELNARPGLAIQIANRRAQPIAPPPTSALERRTQRVAWGLLALIFASPALHGLFGGHEQRVESPVFPAARAAGVLLDPDQGDRPGLGFEWDDQELPASGVSEAFAAGRAFAAAGDTLAALASYRQATTDEAVSAFAWNNLGLLHRSRGEIDSARTCLERAVEAYPSYARGRYNLALFLRDTGRPEDAVRQLERALAIRPGHAASWGALGEIRFQRRDFAAAHEAFSSAVRFEPSRRAWHVREGLSLRLLDRAEEAVGSFEAARLLEPGHEPSAYWWVRSVLDARTERSQRTPVDSLRAALARFAGGKEPSWRCRGLLGMLDRESGHLVKALRTFQDVRTRTDPDGVYSKALASVATELGLWSVAEKALRDVGGAEAAAARRWVALGRALEDPLSESAGAEREVLLPEPFEDPLQEAARGVVLGRSDPEGDPVRGIEDEADRALGDWLARGEGTPLLTTGERAIVPLGAAPLALRAWLVLRVAESRGLPDVVRDAELLLDRAAPDFRPGLGRRFDEARSSGRTEEALRVGKRLLALDAEDLSTRLAVAGLELNSGRSEEARAHLEELGAGQRQLPQAVVVEARLLLAGGQVSEGLSRLRDVVKRVPGDLEARIALAEALSASRRRREAVRELSIVLDDAPGRTDLRRRLARELMRLGRHVPAAREWERVEQLRPGDRSALFNGALCLQRSGEAERSEVLWTRLLEQEPEDWRAEFNRSLAYEKLGRERDAALGYRRVLARKPDHAGSLRKLRALEGP